MDKNQPVRSVFGLNGVRAMEEGLGVGHGCIIEDLHDRPFLCFSSFPLCIHITPMASSRTWREVSLKNIRTDGWLHAFLARQRDGLTGHLEVAGYPFSTRGWKEDVIPLGERGGSGWWPYEQYAYWVDGQLRCGLLLDDETLKRKARAQIDHVLAHPDPDGYLGPATLKALRGERGSERWPHAVFFRAIMADYDERPTRRTLNKLIRHYLSGTAAHETTRNVCNIEIMAWLYEKTGDRRILNLAVSSYRNFQKREPKNAATVKHMLGNGIAREHGPRYMELFKLGAVLYRVTGNRRLLAASVNAQRKLKRDHVLIDGVPSATEHLRGIYSTAGHETCMITDYLWSLGILLAATRDPQYADDMERICFNALPGAVTPDFRALQYFSGPNQVVAGPQTNHHPHGMGSAHMSYRPNPATECCPGNVHRAMPAYIGRMWLDDGRGGIVAALFGPGRVKAGRGVTITQETAYPFDEQVSFQFACRRPVRFRFTFRIPGWCHNASATWNGKTLRRELRAGTFITMNRELRDGDRLELNLPREVRSVRGPENGVGLLWGPLVLALPIRERRTVETGDARSSAEFPAWTMEPDAPWNYALVRPFRRGGVEIRPPFDSPWAIEHAPVRLQVPARRVAGWRLIRKRKLKMKWGDKEVVREGRILFTPPLPGREILRQDGCREEIIELVPYGSTRLRIAWFPAMVPDQPRKGKGTVPRS